MGTERAHVPRVKVCIPPPKFEIMHCTVEMSTFTDEQMVPTPQKSAPLSVPLQLSASVMRLHLHSLCKILQNKTFPQGCLTRCG